MSLYSADWLGSLVVQRVSSSVTVEVLEDLPCNWQPKSVIEDAAWWYEPIVATLELILAGMITSDEGFNRPKLNSWKAYSYFPSGLFL